MNDEKTLTSGYLPVNGLEMYYESHGEGGTPLILIHGAFSAIGTSFGLLLPELSRTRQVVGLELQGHGHTADIDRPLSMESMADDVAEARQLDRELEAEHARRDLRDLVAGRFLLLLLRSHLGHRTEGT